MAYLVEIPAIREGAVTVYGIRVIPHPGAIDNVTLGRVLSLTVTPFGYANPPGIIRPAEDTGQRGISPLPRGNRRLTCNTTLTIAMRFQLSPHMKNEAPTRCHSGL